MDISSKMRLQKFLANAGVASRRKAELLIVDGRITVNGETITQLGTTVSPTDTITLDGEIIQNNAELVYIMLNKPIGVITSATDPQNRPVVLDFVRDIPQRIFPVGRLDYDSSGLLLLTNDGTFAQKMVHPSHSVQKVYIATLQGIPTNQALKTFRQGLKIDKGTKTAPAKIKILDTTKLTCVVRIIIGEGKNRQIRKMCDRIGYPVLKLKRIAIGNLQLANLPTGKWRKLSTAEVADLLGNTP
ncbi:MAG: rRNA pseudouridine synthase [Defluviitaleaceae bacterium]|nr:rRNA pseudouridine synthase [Defluviitaleaceae bacterium]